MSSNANIYTCSQLTQRAQSKQVAKDFLGRMNTSGSVNNNTSYGAPLGIWDDSIMNDVNNGKMSDYRKTMGGIVITDPCCVPTTRYDVPGIISNIFIYLKCVIVTWSPPSNFLKAGTITYTITAIPDTGNSTVVTTINTYYSFNNLIEYRNYTFNITASNGSGSSQTVTSYSIYSPPLGTNSFANNVLVTSNGNVWGGSFSTSTTPYTFVKQTLNNVKCFGTLFNLLGTYPTLQLSTIFPLSDLVAYATTHSSDGEPPGSGVFKTSDGGLSWNSITDGKIFDTDHPFPNYSYWWNQNEGVVIGDANVSSPIDVYYTSNGGTTWTASTIAAANSIASSASNSYYCAIGNTMWCISFEFPNVKFWIHKTTDKGQNFTSVKISDTIQESGTASLSFADTLNGVVTVPGRMYITTDGGSTWSEVLPSPALSIGNLGSIQCVSPTLTFILTTQYIDGRLQNKLWKSTNLFSGSPTFTGISNIDNLTGLSFLNSITGYAPSGFGNGIIKKYLPTASPSVPSISGIYPGNQCALLSIRPSDYEFPISRIDITPYLNGVAGITQQFTSIPANVTGLTNGQNYSFKIQAYTPNSSSAISDFSTSVIPLNTLPPQPTFLTSFRCSYPSTGTTAIASMTYIKPINDGGSPVTSYTAVIEQVGSLSPIYKYNQTGPVTIFTSADGLTTANITNAYVLAVNANGTATASFGNRSTSRATIRTPTYTLQAPPYTGGFSITANLNTGYIPNRYLYSVSLIDTSSFLVNTTCIPNTYSTIPVTGLSQTITFSSVVPGTYVILLRTLNTVSGAGSANSQAVQVTVT